MNSGNKTNLLKALSVPIVILVLFVLAIVGIYIIRNIYYGEPTLVLDNPDISTTNEGKIIITGTTDRNSKLVINDQIVTLEKDGTFNYPAALKDGENKIIVTTEKKSNKKRMTNEKIVIKGKANIQAPTIVTLNNTVPNGKLANSGPKEDFAIIYLILIIFSLFFFRKSLRKKHRLKYELFT